MELIALAVSSFLVGLSGALMPGPVTTVTIAHAMRRGHAAGPLIALGHGVVEGSLVVAMALGLSQLFQSPLVGGIVGLAGGLCLLYMGAGMIRAPAPAELTVGVSAGSSGAGSTVLAGMLTSVSNPYWVLWWATVGATYLMLTFKYGFVGIAAFYLGHFLADLGWLSAIGSTVTAGRRLLTPRIYRGILAVCGMFLVGLGMYFLFSGADYLRQL